MDFGEVEEPPSSPPPLPQGVEVRSMSVLAHPIGKHHLAELIQGRKELGKILQEALDQKMHDWGIQVRSVEIRDVIIPQALEEAMSRQAQADRERKSRIILGTAEIVVGGQSWSEAFGASGITEEEPFTDKQDQAWVDPMFLAKGTALGTRVAELAKRIGAGTGG